MIPSYHDYTAAVVGALQRLGRRDHACIWFYSKEVPVRGAQQGVGDAGVLPGVTVSSRHLGVYGLEVKNKNIKYKKYFPTLVPKSSKQRRESRTMNN